jgi:hypothetical protein
MKQVPVGKLAVLVLLGVFPGCSKPAPSVVVEASGVRAELAISSSWQRKDLPNGIALFRMPEFGDRTLSVGPQALRGAGRLTDERIRAILEAGAAPGQKEVIRLPNGNYLAARTEHTVPDSTTRYAWIIGKRINDRQLNFVVFAVQLPDQGVPQMVRSALLKRVEAIACSAGIASR